MTNIPSHPPRSASLGQIILAILLVLSTGIALSQLSVPRVAPASAPASEFSAERAMQHLGVIAGAPRPVVSPGHEATRAYLIQEIQRLGLTPEVQATTSVLRFAGSPSLSVASVQNVLVRLPGADSTGAIALDAHYDGGAQGPAAADCGSGVVTLLETLRALRAGPPLRNDIILVFSDAEEMGDLGAHAFATQHPWMGDVRLALNYEAMGAGGPATLYVTSRGNWALIEGFARAAPHALTSSFLTELLSAFSAQRLACDLQDYLDEGSAGMGFVFATDSRVYHTALDRADIIDPRSIQHLGGYSMALLRYWGDRDLSGLADDGDAIFFTLWPGAVVRYPAGWAFPLAVAGAVLLAAVMALGMARRRLSAARVALAGPLFLVSVPVTVALVTGIWWGIRALNPNLQVFIIGNRGSDWSLAGLLALSVACMAALSAWLQPRLSGADRAAGALAIMALLALATAKLTPGSSYLLLWPLLAGVVSLGWLLLARRSGASLGWLGAAPAAFVIPLVLVPAATGLFRGLMIRLEGLTGTPFLGVASLFIAPAAGLVLPFLADPQRFDEPHAGRRRWLLPAVALALGVVSLAVGAARSTYDLQNPLPSEVRYELDADSGSARWLTSDARLTSWSSQFIAPGTERDPNVGYSSPDGAPTFSSPAPLASLPTPEMTVLSDATEDGVRSLRLRLAARPGARMLQVQMDAGGSIEAANLGGQPLDLSNYAPATRGTLWFNYAAPPDEGVEVEVRVRDGGTIRVSLADSSDGLPAFDGLNPERPATTMPTPGGVTRDGTIVRRSFSVPGP